jgi:hypothetical protein
VFKKWCQVLLRKWEQNEGGINPNKTELMSSHANPACCTQKQKAIRVGTPKAAGAACAMLAPLPPALQLPARPRRFLVGLFREGQGCLPCHGRPATAPLGSARRLQARLPYTILGPGGMPSGQQLPRPAGSAEPPPLI